MNSVYNNSSRYLYISFVFLLVFSLIAYIYIGRAANNDRNIFKTHAAILADDIWALNESGANSYLQLAVKANHYKSLSIGMPGAENFLSVSSPALSGLSLFLHKIKLIGIKNLSEQIMHNDQIIGTLYGEKYVRVIFPLINILIFLLLLLLTTFFIFHLFINRKFLEQQVLERTRNLLESERRFHDLVNLLPEMVVETDLTGNIIYANKAAKDQLFLNIDPDTAINFFHFIQDDEREKAKRHFQNSLIEKRSGLIEFTAVDRNNRVFPILIRSAPIINGEKISGARVIVIDITERHRLQEQLHRDQKMKAIGLMAGGVAHDLNNILSGIISYPELLLLDLDKESKLRRPLESIRRSGLDASEVVSDLLTVARGIAANKELVAPNVLIRAYLDSTDFQQLQTRYPLISVNTSLASDLHNISCSPIHVRKCLMNLVINGMEAIQGPGTLSILTANHDQSLPEAIDRHNLSKGKFSTITIHDDGSGIAPIDMNHIFEPFYTKKVMGRSGTGLGLAVVWNTMCDHGGTVNVISNEQGTTFELYFPSIETKIPKSPAPQDWKKYKGQGDTILVIDDEHRQREIASQLLTSLDYSVQTVSSGEEAIEYAKHHTTELIVLDMIMPPGLNGRQTFEQILKLHPLQKAIIASGFAHDDDVKATLAMGAKAFIPKPYTLEQIASTVYKILHP
ncbi:MAG: response regulator [Desulfobulbaceae bacterium]|nr:response regulator [Desulfobulbaceae bacterium]